MEKSNCEWRRGNSEGRGTDGEEKREEGDEREVGQERIMERLIWKRKEGISIKGIGDGEDEKIVLHKSLYANTTY